MSLGALVTCRIASLSLLGLAGPGGAEVVHASRRLELAGLSGSPLLLWVLAGLAVVTVAGVLLLYRREEVGKYARVRWVCAALRCLAWLALAVLILDPVRVTDIERESQGVCVILLDESLSMTTRDARLSSELAQAWSEALALPEERVRALTRAVIEERVLLGQPGQGRSMIDRLRAANRVLVFPFGGKPGRRIDLAKLDDPAAAGKGDEYAAIRALKSEGTATDIGAAIDAGLQAVPENLIAGIILLSDGQDSGARGAAAAADQAAARGVRIYTVGVGDPAEPRNVTLQNVLVNEYVLKGNQLSFRAVLTQSAYTGRTAVVRLFEVSGTGRAATRTLITEQRVALDRKLVGTSFDIKPDKVGQHVYEVAVETLPDEQNTADNAVRKHVTVLDDKVSLLLVGGYPSFEYRFLKSLLEQTPGFRASVWLQSQDPRVPQGGRDPLAQFPSTREALLKYDLIILVDPDPTQLPAEWFDRVGNLVSERGNGLIWVAAPRNTVKFFTDKSSPELSRLLPVRTDAERAALAAPGVRTTAWKLALTPRGASAVITQMRNPGTAGEPRTEGAENAMFWEKLPELFWSFPVSEVKPGALVLLNFTNPRMQTPNGQPCPFLVCQFYGLGRVVFVGSDETWRWREAGIDVYERFWLQACRFGVQGRLLGRRKQVEFMTTQREFNFGEPLPVAIRLYDKDFKPLAAADVPLLVRKGETALESLKLKPSGGGTGVYETLFYPPGPGAFELECRSPAGASATHAISVKPPAGELENVRLNEPLLKKIADTTGGRYVTPGELGSLPEQIAPRVIRHVESRPPEPIWNRGVVLALLIGLITVEWVVRKWLGLL